MTPLAAHVHSLSAKGLKKPAIVAKTRLSWEFVTKILADPPPRRAGYTRNLIAANPHLPLKDIARIAGVSVPRICQLRKEMRENRI